MIYEGHNGSIAVEGEELVLRREGLVARAAFGKDVPPRRIPLRVISGVAMQDASRLKNGHITLGLGGEPAPSLGIGAAGSNGDTVLFTRKHRDHFGQLKTWLGHVVQINQAQGFQDVDVPAGGGQVGRFDKRAQQVEQWAEAKGEQARLSEEIRQQERQVKDEAAGLRPDIALAASRMGWRLGGGREIKKLQEHLHDGETVRYIAQGTYAKDQGIVVLTDSRLVFVFHGLVRQAIEDFPLRSISSVQSKAGIATGDLTVHASGNNAVITNIIKPDLKFLADALRQHLAGPPQASAFAPTATAQPDVMDQLRKLGELRDAGVLTPEEFDAKKSELLSRL